MLQTIHDKLRGIFAVVVLGAVQMFVLALLGEYIGRLYNEAKHRPLYIVQEVAGRDVGQARLELERALREPSGANTAADDTATATGSRRNVLPWVLAAAIALALPARAGSATPNAAKP